MLMIVFSVFLGRLGGLSGGDIPYPLFVLTGLIAWTLFATAAGQAWNGSVGSERLITKIYFPQLAVKFTAAGVAVFDFTVSLGLLATPMADYTHPHTLADRACASGELFCSPRPDWELCWPR
jgi:lipopolysaccharide transport system permease protein